MNYEGQHWPEGFSPHLGGKESTLWDSFIAVLRFTEDGIMPATTFGAFGNNEFMRAMS